MILLTYDTVALWLTFVSLDSSMHCPNCGNESSLDQKFCRKCGFNLEPVSKLVSAGAASGEVATDRAEHERLVVRRMFRWLAAGCIGLLAGMILLIINKGFVHEPMFQSIAFLFVIGGLAIATYGALSSMLKGTYLPGNVSKSADQIGQNSATKELPAGDAVPISVSNVTERTTELIGRKAKPNSD